MKFKTHNEDKSISANGTSYRGYIVASYYQLLGKFGEPEPGDGYCMDACWTIKFEDGTIATIYNYKNGENYNGPVGIPVEDIHAWNIGGFENKALDYIGDLMMNRSVVEIA